MEKYLIKEKSNQISQTTKPKEILNSKANKLCPSCKSQISDEYAYSCNSCGTEFDLCFYSGLAILQGDNSQQDWFRNCVLQCLLCKQKSYLFGWVLYESNPDKLCGACDSLDIGYSDTTPRSFSFQEYHHS